MVGWQLLGLLCACMLWPLSGPRLIPAGVVGHGTDFVDLMCLQILLSPLWTEGAGAGTGEDCEHFFSVESQRIRVVRSTGLAVSVEILTQSAIQQADSKVAALPAELARRCGLALVLGVCNAHQM